jgi:hypothetical protein
MISELRQSWIYVVFVVRVCLPLPEEWLQPATTGPATDMSGLPSFILKAILVK